MTITHSHGASVHRYYDAVDRGDIGALLALFAPDAVYHRPGYPPISGSAELEWFYRNTRVIQHGTHRLTGLIESGDEVAVHGEFSGVLRNGSVIEVAFADFFCFDQQGRFAERRTFFFAPVV